MDYQDWIEELLERACPSIKFRLRSEVLGQSTEEPVLRELQRQILEDPDVLEVFGWQQTDGWMAWDFHGTRSLETSVRWLREKGLSNQQHVLKRALQALDEHPERLERGIGKVGKILDELGFGGSQMIRASVYAYAGMEKHPTINTQVNEALAGFRAVLKVERMAEIVEDFHGRLVFKPGVNWPSIYHLRLLAYTHGWRTLDNQAMLVNAIKQLVILSPIPNTYVRSHSRVAAPASFAMQDFNPDPVTLDAAGWMLWIHRMECLARLGVLSALPKIASQIEQFMVLLNKEPSLVKRKINHAYFTKWGAYTGIRLETDWRQPKRVLYDLAFRWALIDTDIKPRVTFGSVGK